MLKYLEKRGSDVHRKTTNHVTQFVSCVYVFDGSYLYADFTITTHASPHQSTFPSSSRIDKALILYSIPQNTHTISFALFCLFEFPNVFILDKMILKDISKNSPISNRTKSQNAPHRGPRAYTFSYIHCICGGFHVTAAHNWWYHSHR